jgi:Thioesterase-like superfamily
LLIAIVPHGGYVTSCFMRVATMHFSTTLKKQNQPHCMALHLEFPRRTEIGPARLVVKDVKLGRQTSIVHLTLSQHGKEEVFGYLTHSNLQAEEGVTFPTGWTLEPPTAPLLDAQKLMNQGGDANWAERKETPFANFRKASHQVRFFFPRNGQPMNSIIDQWICLRDGSKFTTESLGYVTDMFPQIVENYREDEDPTGVAAALQKGKPTGAKYWYPTVVLNIDVKKALPEEGVDFLFCRTRSKQIRKGRFDIEVVVMDEAGEVIALSHHIALVLSAGRNLAARRRETPDSKI